MPRAQGARSILSGAFESTYGTAPGSGFMSLPFNRNMLGGAAQLLDDPVLGQGRDPLAPQLDALDVNGDIEVPLDVEAVGIWLKAAFGAPATTGSSTYTHVFSSGGWSVPSLALETGIPEVSHYMMHTGCMVDRLQFGQARKGWASLSVGLVGQAETVNSSTQAGTPDEFEYQRFLQRQGSITRGGSALADVVSAEITYSNNLEPAENVGNGGLIAGADPNMASLGVRLVTRFSSAALVDQAIAGGSAAFTFAYSDGTNSLTFSVPKLFLDRPKRMIEGPGGIQVTFDGRASQDAGGDPMVTATLVNTVDAY